MRVRTLIQLLETVDPELEVIISSDPEGNGFYGLSQIDDTRFVESPVDRWYHEGTYEKDDVTEEEDGEELILPGYDNVLILWA